MEFYRKSKAILFSMGLCRTFYRMLQESYLISYIFYRILQIFANGMVLEMNLADLLRFT